MSNGVDFRKLAVDLRGQLTTAQSDLAALREELSTQDRVLRSSVPEPHKACTSPVGAVQSYIAELEERNAALREALDSVAFYFRQHGVDHQLREIVEEALCMDKPAESGASE